MIDTNLLDTSDNIFSVYPNAITNAIYIDIYKHSSTIFYVIYDKKGRIIKENHQLSKRNTISMHSFPAGVYTIEINDQKTIVTQQILKL